jgi:hypothetical protein
MTNDKPNLTDSHFAEILAEPFAGLLKPKKFYPTITVEYSPSREEWAQIAEAIWVGALEGGSNHWIDYIHTGGHVLKSGFDVVDSNFNVAIHHGSDGWGEPLEEDESVEYMQAFDVIVDGINLLDPERQRLALTVDELGQLDANDYDYIIQLGVFGKEVYC